VRPDLDVVAGLVGHGARVLDLGCGDGALLEHLTTRQGCVGHGIERSVEGFHACIARGVPVSLGDLHEELLRLDEGAFDCAVLSLTLQATSQPADVLAELLRVASRCVVSLPNFGHWRLRTSLLVRGRMPANRALPYAWYDTPNVHLCTLRDFEDLVAATGWRRGARVLLDEDGRARSGGRRVAPNLLAAGAAYLLTR
jgi:methionine biosynthesis protein MetW